MNSAELKLNQGRGDVRCKHYAWEALEIHTKFERENVKGRDHLRYQTEAKIQDNIKIVLNKQGKKVCNGFI